MTRLALKNLFAHKIRTAFLMLCIVLGVSFVSGTYVLTDTILRTFNNIFEEVYSHVDVTVRTESDLGAMVEREPVPESLLPALRAVDGVSDVQGSVFALSAEIVDKEGKRVGIAQAPAFGLEWSPNDDLTPLVLRSGKKPSGPDEVAIDAASFKDGKFTLGDRITLIVPDGPREFTLVGVAGFGKADNVGGATLAIFDTATAQQVMHRVALFDSINVRAADGVSADVLQERIQAILPSGIEAVTAQTLTDESSESLKDNLQFINIFMLTFAYIALFVGAFIIYNTFSIVVSERTREMALLRALGATDRQVLTSVVTEALAIGLMSSLVGLGAGVLMAIGLKALLAAFGIGIPQTSMVLLGRTVAVAMIGGTAITLVSAIGPAIRAGRVPPLAAMRSFRRSERAATVRRNLLGLVAAVVGAGLVLSGLAGSGLGRVGIGALAMFLGVAMMAPMIARPAAGLLGRPARRFRGAPGLLARQNAMRSARRTATTAASLMIGTALLAGSLVLSSSLTKSVEEAVSQGAVAPLVIRTDSQIGFSPAIQQVAAGTPGVRHAYPLRVGVFKLGEATKSLDAIEPEALVGGGDDPAIDVGLEEGSIAPLAGEAIAVSTIVAKDHGWTVGDRLTVTFPAGTRELTIVAIYTENQLMGDYLVSLDTFNANYPQELDLLVLVTAAPSAVDEVKAALTSSLTADFPGVKVQDKDEYVGDVKQQVDMFLRLITALLGLAIVIALFGVLIAMLLAVFERTHELGLLRAVGMARTQLRAMVRWEAAIISVFGALLGTALGLFFGYSLTRALHDQGVRSVVIPVWPLITLIGIITALGVVAALYPARRAGRLNILTAVASE